MSNRLKLAREFLEGAQSTYIARISLESADNSSEIENRMKTLSSVATIFVPLTTITGIWGMNVVVPGQSGVRHFLTQMTRGLTFHLSPYALACWALVFSCRSRFAGINFSNMMRTTALCWR